MYGEITLKTQLNATETESVTICCEVDSITQSEYATVWAHEYNDQTELEYNGQRLTIYRTYKKPNEEKLELYAEKRAGKR